MLEALGLLFEILKEFPEFLGALLEIKHFWEQHQDQALRDAQVLKLKEAMDAARASKDTTQLTALVNSIVTGKPITGS